MGCGQTWNLACELNNSVFLSVHRNMRITLSGVLLKPDWSWMLLPGFWSCEKTQARSCRLCWEYRDLDRGLRTPTSWFFKVGSFFPSSKSFSWFSHLKRGDGSHRLVNVILWDVWENNAHKSLWIHSWERSNKGWFRSGVETSPESHNSWEVEAELIKMLSFLASNFVCSPVYHTPSAISSLKLRTALPNRVACFTHSYFFALRNPVFVASSDIAAC